MNTATPESSKKKSRKRMITIIACVAALVAIITAVVLAFIGNTRSEAPSRPRTDRSSESPDKSGTDTDDSSRADQEHSDTGSGALETELIGSIGYYDFEGKTYDSASGLKRRISDSAFFNTENGMMYFAFYSDEFFDGQPAYTQFYFEQGTSNYAPGCGIILVRTGEAVSEMDVMFDHTDVIFRHRFTEVSVGNDEDAKKWTNGFIAGTDIPLTADECMGTYRYLDYDKETNTLAVTVITFDEIGNSVRYSRDIYTAARGTDDEFCCYFYNGTYWAYDHINGRTEFDSGFYSAKGDTVTATFQKSGKTITLYRGGNDICFDLDGKTFAQDSVWTNAYVGEYEENGITYEKLYIERLAFTKFGTVIESGVYYVKYNPEIEHFEDIYSFIDDTCWAIPGMGFPSSYGTYNYNGSEVTLRFYGSDVGEIYDDDPTVLPVKYDRANRLLYLGGEKFVQGVYSLVDLCIEFDIPYEMENRAR